MSDRGKRDGFRAVFFVDIAAIVLAVVGIFAFRSSDIAFALSSKVSAVFQADTFYFYLLSAVLFLPAVFRLNSLYKAKIIYSGVDQFVQLFKSYLTHAVALIVLMFFFKNASFADNARGYLLGFSLLGLATSTLFRLAIGYAARRSWIRLSLPYIRSAVVVGTEPQAEEFALRVMNDPALGIENVHFVSVPGATPAPESIMGFPVIGQVEELHTHVLTTGAEVIYVFLNEVSYDELLAIVAQCKATGLPVKVASRHFDIIAREGGIVSPQDALGNLQLSLPVAIRPDAIAKRFLDLSVALAICAALSVPCLLLALAIKLTSRGPVFYLSTRVGMGGRIFKMFKFRTMYLNDESYHRDMAVQRLKEGHHMGKVNNDPRITPIGKFLRKYSIDEIPQIINVVRGEMSLVGPRPCLPYEMDFFHGWHKRRFLVLPGMTGLWQVTGRQMDNLTINEAMILDVFYAENCTVWMDLKIMLKTIPVVVFGKGT